MKDDVDPLVAALIRERFAPPVRRPPETETADDDVTCARRRRALDEAWGKREREAG